MSEDKKPEELMVGSLTVKGNTLVYENQAIQINTLTAIWIDDLTVNVKHPFPNWIKIVATVASLAIFIGLVSHEPILMAIGIVLLSISIARFTKYVPNSKKPRFALGIEKASGECIIFPSADKNAINNAANALFDSISNKENLHETFVLNIAKKVPMKKSVGSKIFLLKKKPPAAAPKLLAKKPTEKLVENIEQLKPKPPEPPAPPTPPPEPKKEEKPEESAAKPEEKPNKPEEKPKEKA